MSGVVKWGGNEYDLDDPCDRIEIWNNSMSQTAEFVNNLILKSLPQNSKAVLLQANSEWLQSHTKQADPRCYQDSNSGRSLVGGR